MVLPQHADAVSVTQRWKRKKQDSTDKIAMSTYYALCDRNYFDDRGLTLLLFPKFKGTTTFDLSVRLWYRDPVHNPREEDQSTTTFSHDLSDDGLCYDSRAVPAFRGCLPADDFLIGKIDSDLNGPFIYGFDSCLPLISTSDTLLPSTEFRFRSTMLQHIVPLKTHTLPLSRF